MWQLPALSPANRSGASAPVLQPEHTSGFLPIWSLDLVKQRYRRISYLQSASIRKFCINTPSDAEAARAYLVPHAETDQRQERGAWCRPATMAASPSTNRGHVLP
jgi:hypothetical protein